MECRGEDIAEVPADAGDGLLAEAELFDHGPVPLDFRGFQVVEQSTALTHHSEQAPATMMVALVDLEVLRQVLDAFGEKRDLYFGRA